ncbi:MAG: YafY family transcriptional regulator [Gammaproteobacteria bacterium]|nr:YafY family transcriptional regulator [Gammaproteobacteria bacterium]
MPTMRPADRLFQIVLHLGRGRVLTAQTLAQRLEVSERTIYRDIQNLMESGVPVDGEAGVGYRLHRGYQVPPMMFDQNELQALIFGAQVAKRWGDHEMAAAADRILNKVDAVLPENLRPTLNAQTLVVPEMASFQSEQTTQTLGDVRDAINQRRRLYLSYSDAENDPTERIVWPLTLLYWGYSWAVGAWCELRQDFRNFRVDRIVEARSLTTQFPDESGKRLEDYFKQANDKC